MPKCSSALIRHLPLNMTTPRIYLAGPDVFLPDADAHLTALEQLCEAAGLRGVRPSDGGLAQDSSGTGDEKAERIYQANVALIRSSDGVLANLCPFRGAIEPDSGTVWETGFATALGKPVYGYLRDHDQPLERKVQAAFGVQRDGEGVAWDRAYGLMVEEFGLPTNLMLARSMATFESVVHALEAMKVLFNPRPLKALVPIRH